MYTKHMFYATFLQMEQKDSKNSKGNEGVYASIDMNCVIPKTHRVLVREYLVSGKSVSFYINAKQLTTEQVLDELMTFEEKTLRTQFVPQLFMTNKHPNRRSHCITITPIDKSQGHAKSFSLFYPEYSVREIGEAISKFLCHGKVVLR